MRHVCRSVGWREWSPAAAWLPCGAPYAWRQWEGSFEVPWKGNKKVPADEGPFPDSSEAVLSLQTTVDSKVVDAKYTINSITADTLAQQIMFLFYPALPLN